MLHSQFAEHTLVDLLNAVKNYFAHQKFNIYIKGKI